LAKTVIYLSERWELVWNSFSCRITPYNSLLPHLLERNAPLCSIGNNFRRNRDNPRLEIPFMLPFKGAFDMASELSP
jgi:hypothetical protein